MDHHEIICPHCNKAFKVDESGYAAILSQVRNNEYKKDLEKAEMAFEENKKNAVNLAVSDVTVSFQTQMNEKDQKILNLKNMLQNAEEKHKAEIDVYELRSKDIISSSIKEKDEEILRLKEALSEAKGKVNSFESDKKLAVIQKENEMKDAVAQKNLEIEELKNKVERMNDAREMADFQANEKYQNQIRLLSEQVAFYKDFKARQSTKMIGESLEKYCMNLFESVRLTGYRNAYFDKDNDVVDGSKGDFVFRDYTDEGMEYISIMFEMKNEADETVTKHRNEDFFPKLDRDRKNKKCEYAVLVSLLEGDSERYNAGIVEVAGYEKMYVVRPQCFLPIIQILRDVNERTIKDRLALMVEREKNIDITHFEEDLNTFKMKFGMNIENSQKKFQEAIDSIDKSIKDLEKVKNALTLSIKHLNSADNKLEDLTIKKLVRNNPTMKNLFEKAEEENRKKEAEEVEAEVIDRE